MSTESTQQPGGQNGDAAPAPQARPLPRRPRSPLGRIRWALEQNLDLPSLGELGPRIATVALSASNQVERVSELAMFDPAIVLKLLRAANSTALRTRSGDPVCSVSRAVMLLGFDETRQTALGLNRLDESIDDPDHERLVRAEYAYANVAAMLTRNILYGRHPGVAEEGAAAALFGASARILCAIHAPQAHAQILQASEVHAIDVSAAARRLLGVGYEEISLEALHAWHMPARFGQLLRAANNLRPRVPEIAADWLPLSIACATEVTQAIAHNRPQERRKRLSAVVEKFGNAVDLDERSLERLVEESTEDARRLDAGLLGNLLTPSVARMFDSHLAGETRIALPAPRPSVEELTGAVAESGSAQDAVALLESIAGGANASPERMLHAAMQAIEQLLARHASGLSPVLSLVLAGIKLGMNYSRVSYYARDDSTSTYRARLAIGVSLEHLRQYASMGTGFSRDLFHAALDRGVDLHIGDISAANVQSRLPDWFSSAYPKTMSFLILPIRVEDRPVGFILADRDQTDPDGPSNADLEKLRGLRNQIGALHLSGMAEMEH